MEAVKILGPLPAMGLPLVLLAQNRPAQAAAALRNVPDPPRDLLFETLWCLTARAAIAVGDTTAMEYARNELTPAAAELAGAGSGLLTLGPVSQHLRDLDAALADSTGCWSGWGPTRRGALAKIMERTTAAKHRQLLLDQAAMIERLSLASVDEESGQAGIDRAYQSVLRVHAALPASRAAPRGSGRGAPAAQASRHWNR